MRRTLLILDGTNELEAALADARHLCDPGDKLTVLAVAEKPSPAILGTKPSPAAADPYTGSGPSGGVQPRGGLDVPEVESEDATERRVAGDLRDKLDEKVAEFDAGDVEVWTQAIVRDEPAEAVANYIRSSDVTQIAVPRRSLPRLHELLRKHGEDPLDGKVTPLIILPA